jgi:hypothetical protein
MQLRKQRDKDFPRGIDGGQGHGSSKDTANIGGEVWDVTGFKNHGNVVEDDQGTKYIQEWEIDWQPIVDSTRLYGGTWKWDGGSLNLDVQAADNTGLPAGATTGGRTQQSFWNSNADVQWDDTRAEGLVILSTKVDVRGIAPMVNSVSMNTLVTNDVLTFSTTVKSLSIYDLTGKAVVDNLQNVSSVNIGYLSSGIYLVRIDNMTHKIVKR